MTHKEEILAFLAERPGLWIDDDELANALGINPRQTVNRICRELYASGLIRREQRDGKIRNSALASGASEEIAATAQPQGEAPEEASMTPAGFEALAEAVLSQHFGVRLSQGTIPGVPKRFDLVSPGGDVVGDAKFYTLVGGGASAPGQVLCHSGARLALGEDRRPGDVPGVRKRPPGS